MKEAGEKALPYGMKLLFSGRKQDDMHADGVGFILSKEALEALITWKPINERLI